MKLWSPLVLVAVVSAIVEAEEDWSGSRPPPFFPSGKERPIPRYAPTFSRYTPFLTEDTLPKPVYGRQRQAPSEPESIYKQLQSRPPPREGLSNNGNDPIFPFQRPPIFPPGNYQGRPYEKPSPREYPEPFRGPHGETEETPDERPPFLPPQYHGQRLPPPEYFNHKQIHERPFFGPIPGYNVSKNEQIEHKGPIPKPTLSPNNTAPEYGSDIQLEKAKARPDRLFAIKPPEFPIIPSPPPYPSPAPFTPFPTQAIPQVTTIAPPSIYSPLQGPYPEAISSTAPSVIVQQQGSPPKKKPNGLPPSFRSFFPPGFGPFADGKERKKF